MQVIRHLEAIRPASRMHRGSWFTLIELLVVVTIIAVLAALLMPALSKAKRRVLITTCMNNHKQMYLARTMYYDDYTGFNLELGVNAPGGWGSSHWGRTLRTPHDQTADCRAAAHATHPDHLPYQPTHFGILMADGYVTDGRIFYCTDAERTGDSYDTVYGNNASAKTFDDPPTPQNTPWITMWQRVIEIDPTKTNLAEAYMWPERHKNLQRAIVTCLTEKRKPVKHHFAGVNVTYGDGQVKFVHGGSKAVVWGGNIRAALDWRKVDQSY